MLISLLGQRFADKLGVLSNPRGWFKRVIGILFLLVGLAIITGVDKDIETKIVNSGFFDVTKIENQLLDRIER